MRNLHGLEEEIQKFSDDTSGTVKCGKLEDLSRELLTNRSITKDNLVDMLLKMGNIITTSRQILRSAMVQYDEQKTDLLQAQSNLLEEQSKLLSKCGDKLDEVHETVKSEMMTFSDVVKKNCSTGGSTVNQIKLKKAVKSVFTDDERKKSIMIFGAPEEISCKGEKLSDKDVVDNVVDICS